MFEKDNLASSVSTFALSIASLATARAVAAALMRRRRSAVLFAPPRLRPDPGLAPPWAMVVLTVGAYACVAPLRGFKMIRVGCAPVGLVALKLACHATVRRIIVRANVLRLDIRAKSPHFQGLRALRSRR